MTEENRVDFITRKPTLAKKSENDDYDDDSTEFLGK
jgi:hypothetical protein